MMLFCKSRKFLLDKRGKQFYDENARTTERSMRQGNMEVLYTCEGELK